MPVLVAAIERLPRVRLCDASYERFVRQIFGETRFEAHIAHCRWLYEQNPAAADEDHLPIYVCHDDDAIVGQLAIIPMRIVLEGVHLRAGWCVDFFVLPSHQRRGLGRQLLTAAHADFPLLMSLGQTEASRNLFLRCGWHNAGAMSTYKRYLRPMRCVTKKALETLRRAPAGNAPPASESAPPRLRPHLIDRCPSGDQRTKSDLRGASAPRTRVCRSTDFMRWRYSNAPHLTYSTQRHQFGHLPPALAVWRRISDPPWQRGVLVDLVYPPDLPDAGLFELLTLVADAMRTDDVDVFECQTSDPRVLTTLPRGPFTALRPGPHFVYGGIDGTTWPLIAADQWRLYAGDCDVDALHARGPLP